MEPELDMETIYLTKIYVLAESMAIKRPPQR